MTNCPPKFLQSNNRKQPVYSDYQLLMGNRDWFRLHPAIRQRFSKNEKRSVTYRGVMREVQLSFAGKLLAQACRLIGTPLALYAAKNVPITVRVYPDVKRQGMTWDRYYHYPEKPMNRIKSTKCILEKEGLVELVGFGFGMKLQVFEKNAAMVFESKSFFIQLGRFKIKLPDWFTPGKTVVRQRAIDNQLFEFELSVTHKWFGILFYQVGEFKLEK